MVLPLTTSRIYIANRYEEGEATSTFCLSVYDQMYRTNQLSEVLSTKTKIVYYISMKVRRSLHSNYK